MLGRDPHTGRQAAAEGLAHDALGFAVAVSGRHVDQGDARLDRLTQGRDGLLMGG
jgi:hypothetical protein